MEEDFGRLWAEHHRHVLAYALRRTGQRADAEDIVSSTFAVAWRRFGDKPSAEFELRGFTRSPRECSRTSVARCVGSGLRNASAFLGGPVPLPAPSLTSISEARAIGDCPPKSSSRSLYGCSIEVAVAGQPRALVYERASTLWRSWPDTRVFDLDGVRAAEFRATRLSVKPATWVVNFVIAGTRVEVAGSRDFARKVARSIIDRSK